MVLWVPVWQRQQFSASLCWLLTPLSDGGPAVEFQASGNTWRVFLISMKIFDVAFKGPIRSHIIWSCMVWFDCFVQQFVDFQTGLNFVAQQSGCATVWSVYGHVCELSYCVTSSSLILISFASSFQNITYNCKLKISGRNLYSYVGRYRNYGKWKVMCIKTAIWRMLATTN